MLALFIGILMQTAHSSVQAAAVARHEVVTERTELGLLAVAMIQAALFVWQLTLMRRSIGDTRKAANAAGAGATAARDAAEAARDSVRLMDRTAERHLRAYVFIDTMDIANVARPLAPPLLKTGTENLARIIDPTKGPTVIRMLCILMRSFGCSTAPHVAKS